MNIVGLVPARGGSKGIPRKNLVPLAGKPLLAWTAQAALASPSLSRVVLSTDDPGIAAAARDLGLEVPFMRPAALASDEAGAVEVIRHAIEALEADGPRVDAVAYLQPTSPLRTAAHIESAVALFGKLQADTVVSVCAVPHSMAREMQLEMHPDGRLSALEAAPPRLRRQDKPRRYARNGPAVLVVARRCIVELGALYGERTYGLEMDRHASMDVDDAADLELIAAWMQWQQRR